MREIDRDGFIDQGLDVLAVLGFLVWISVYVSGVLGLMQMVFLFAPLVLMPLAVRIVSTPGIDGGYSFWYRLSVYLLPLAMFTVPVSLYLSPGSLSAVLAVPWMLFTLALAGFGARRLLPRGVRPLPELSIDAGMYYIQVGGLWLVMSNLGLNPWGFSGDIVFFTAIHFHYAGFMLPVIAGIAGRELGGRLYVFAASVIVVGPGLIALGILFSPAVEVLSVSFYTVSVALFGALVMYWAAVNLREEVLGALLLVFSSLAIIGSMGLALLYGYSKHFVLPVGLEQSTMVSLHGQLNAFGFALGALVAWRYLYFTVGIRSPPVLKSLIVFPDAWRGFSWGSGNPRDDDGISTDDSRCIEANDFMDVDEGVIEYIEGEIDEPVYVDIEASRLGSVLLYLRGCCLFMRSQFSVPRNYTDGFMVDRTRKDLESGYEIMSSCVDDGECFSHAIYRFHEICDMDLMVSSYPVQLGDISVVMTPIDGDERDGLTTSQNGYTGVYLNTAFTPVLLPINHCITASSKDDVIAESLVEILGKEVFRVNYMYTRN